MDKQLEHQNFLEFGEPISWFDGDKRSNRREHLQEN